LKARSIAVDLKMMALRVRLRKALDLTEPRILSELGINLKMLSQATDYDLTRQIATLALKSGFEAILAPSSTGPGKILAIFFGSIVLGIEVGARKEGKIASRKSEETRPTPSGGRSTGPFHD